MDERSLQDFSREIFEENKNSKKVEIYLDGEKFYEIKNFIQVTERIKTVEDAFRELGYHGIELKRKLDYSTDDNPAYFVLKAVTRALNEGWKSDWNNSEPKWYPLFEISDKQQGLILKSVESILTFTSRSDSMLLFKSKELAEYAGTQFKYLYEFYLLD